MDLALNNLQRLICHKTQQTKPSHKPNLVAYKTHLIKNIQIIKNVFC